MAIWIFRKSSAHRKDAEIATKNEVEKLGSFEVEIMESNIFLSSHLLKPSRLRGELLPDFYSIDLKYINKTLKEVKKQRIKNVADVLT